MARIRSRLTSPKAIRALGNVEQARCLKPFFGEALSLAQAAERLGTSVEALYRPVVRLEQLGLLRVVKTESRRGRAFKYYRTPGPAFFIPASIVGIEQLGLKNERGWHRLLERSLIEWWLGGVDASNNWGLHVVPGKVGGEDVLAVSAGLPPQQLAGAAEPDPTFFSWYKVELNKEDSLAFKRALGELTAEFRAKATPGETRYVVHLAFVGEAKKSSQLSLSNCAAASLQK